MTGLDERVKGFSHFNPKNSISKDGRILSAGLYCGNISIAARLPSATASTTVAPPGRTASPPA